LASRAVSRDLVRGRSATGHAAFSLFRIFEIWKPWPVGLADRRFPGGLGIMLDDLLAAVYAVLVLLVALMTGGEFGVRS
jgi:phosphatidylglycerophosphatase A